MADRVPQVSAVSGEEKSELRLCARVADVSDTGRRRHNNQDCHLVLPFDPNGVPQDGSTAGAGIDLGRLLLVVADGMGGHFRGEVASRMCVENITKELAAGFQSSPNGGDYSDNLKKAVEAAHQAVFAYGQSCADNLTMGTTCTAMLIHGAYADLAQVGDSRCYLFRQGKLAILTQDQTIGNQLRSRGEDAQNVDPQIREMLIQAVGAQAQIEVVMSSTDLEPEDLILICCDGLYKVVSEADIVATMESEIGLQERAQQLVNRANDNGGPDNITVILAEIGQTDGGR